MEDLLNSQYLAIIKAQLVTRGPAYIFGTQEEERAKILSGKWYLSETDWQNKTYVPWVTFTLSILTGDVTSSEL